MAKQSLPSPDVLHQVLTYEPESGRFFWKRREGNPQWNGKFAGMETFTTKLKGSGYLYSSVFGVKMYAHRVAWAMHYGKWPEGEIDHVNTIKSDNRISNLRDSSRTENLRNIRKFPSNKSGFKGVSLHKQTGKWHARISTGTDYKSLGLFCTPEDAAKAYAKAAEFYHGEYARAE